MKEFQNPSLYKKREKYEPYYFVKDRNEPAFIHQVFDIVCAIRGINDSDKQQFAEQIYSNTERLFFPEKVKKECK